MTYAGAGDGARNGWFPVTRGCVTCALCCLHVHFHQNGLALALLWVLVWGVCSWQLGGAVLDVSVGFRAGKHAQDKARISVGVVEKSSCLCAFLL
jgi:hypothetical protein